METYIRRATWTGIVIIILFASMVQSETPYEGNSTPTIMSNIIIVIDASGSTAYGDAVSGISFISLINANAINIVQNIGNDSNVGVVAFGGGKAENTGMLSMGSTANKKNLENFIRQIGPNTGDITTDLDVGLLAADELLKPSSCKKEIIVISDGMMPPEGFGVIKSVVENLTNEDIKIHFVQVLASRSESKVPNPLYNELAKISGQQPIVLYPDERINRLVFESEEPCSAYTSKTTPTAVIATTQIATPTPTNESSLEQEVKDLKERLKKIEDKQNQQEGRTSWLESAINSLLKWLKSLF